MALPTNVSLRDLQRLANEHQNFKATIAGIYDVRPVAAASRMERYHALNKSILDLIGIAQRNGTRLRALGSNWSFSQIGMTDGHLINTKMMNAGFRLRGDEVRDDYEGEAEHLFLFHGGLTIATINRALESAGLSLSTSGASNGQTLAGATATGTHGAAIDFGAMPEFVEGIHLAVGPRKQVWLQRRRRRVVNGTLPTTVGAELIEDDDLFDAALVNLGGMGVVLGVLVRAEPRYLLHAYNDRIDDDDALRHTMTTLDFDGLALPRQQRPWHFALILNPHDDRSRPIYTVMYREPDAPHEPPLFRGGGTGPGDDALAFIDGAIDLLLGLGADDLVADVIGRMMDDLYGERIEEIGTHGEIFRSTNLPNRSASTAIAIEASRTLDVLELIQRLNHDHGPMPGAIGLRYVGPSTATLGFTRYAPTCVLEIDGVDGRRMRSFYRRVWKALRAADVPHALHWGKIHELDEAAVRWSYGDQRVESWRRARRELLSPKAREVFSSPMLQRMGLC